MRKTKVNLIYRENKNLFHLYHSLNAADIDALGSSYIDNILNSYVGGTLNKKAPGKYGGWSDDQLPASLNKFRGTVGGLKEAMVNVGMYDPIGHFV